MRKFTFTVNSRLFEVECFKDAILGTRLEVYCKTTDTFCLSEHSIMNAGKRSVFYSEPFTGQGFTISFWPFNEVKNFSISYNIVQTVDVLVEPA